MRRITLAIVVAAGIAIPHGAAWAAKKAKRAARAPDASALPVWLYDPEAPVAPPEIQAPARAPAAVSEAPLVLEKAPKFDPRDPEGSKPVKVEKLPEQPALIEAPKTPPSEGKKP
jgi:hypothetical protein